MGMHMKLIKTSFKNTNKQTNKRKKTPTNFPKQTNKTKYAVRNTIAFYQNIGR